jgi:hypothetical protein
MSFLSPPSAPDPNQTSQAQAAYNQQAATAQQKTNMINQFNPYGGLGWTADPNAPGGYSANVTLSPQQQQLFNQLYGSQASLGGAGQSLAANIAGMYSTPPDLTSQAGLAGQQMQQLYNQYQSPIFKQQESNLTAQLLNQGLTPGSEAWNNAQNLQARNEANAQQSFAMGFEPIAFQQALQQYQLPLQNAQTLMQAGAPTMPNQSFVGTPTAQIQPPNYQGAVQQNYQQQMANYENNINAMAKVAGAALAIPTGGASLLPGLFGGLSGGMGGGGYGITQAGAGMPTFYGGIPVPTYGSG